MVRIENILDCIDSITPFELAEEWDNVGLILGRKDLLVDKVLLCVDVTSSVINEAIESNSQLIISHHPFVFSPLTQINDSIFKGRQILKLAENKIGVISVHTNVDRANGGINDYLASLLGLSNIYHDESSYLRVGEIPSILADKFIEIVKEKLGINFVVISGQLPETIRKVGVFTGSADEEELLMNKDKFDLVVTGELSHHKALDLEEEGISSIMCSHFSSELIFTDWMKEFLNNEFPDLDIVCSKVERNPFRVL